MVLTCSLPAHHRTLAPVSRSARVGGPATALDDEASSKISYCTGSAQLAMQYSGRRFASLPRQRAPAGRPCSTFRAAPLCDVYQFPPRPRAGEQIYKSSRLFSISFLWADLKQESVTHYSKRASNRGGRVGGASSARPSPTKREGELAPTGRGRCGRRDSGRHEWQRGQRAGDGRRRDRRDN